MNIAQFFAVGLDTSLALPATYDPVLVIASYVVATLAGYAFLRLTSRIVELGEPQVRFKWMLGGGLTMGLGVWAMHFVAMLAYRLPIPVGYDPVVTSASAFPAIFGAAVALYLAARPHISLRRLLLAGVFLGGGIGTMHYTGMLAMQLDAFVRYDPLLFLTSIFVAVALAIVALLIARRAVRRGEAGTTPTDSVMAAGVMGFAVAGMHYTAMTSTMCFSAPGLHQGVFGVDPQVFAAATTVVAALVLVMAIGSVIFDRKLAVESEGRAQAAGQLRAREQHLAVIMDNVADGLITIDRDGSITSFNRSAETIFGYSAAEVIGKSVTVIMAEGLREAHRNGFIRYLETGQARVLGKGPVEVLGRRKDGKEINIELVVSKAQEGDEPVFVGALRDVTERRAIQAQLQQAQKMEAVGQLTGGIAHDFNNLLGIIIGNLDLARENLPLRSEEETLVRGALDSALRGADLSRRLLAFSRRQSLQPQVVDPNTVFAGMTELLQRAIGERISFELFSAKDIWSVKVDLAQLESAIVNLAVNARDAMPSGGALILETSNVVVDEEYASRHPGMRPGEYVCIAVSDTGVGMTAEVQARAFEPFFTTKPTGKGSGLGLSMVFGFIKQSDGHVNIYSEPGHGTIVRLYLPRADCKAVKAAQARHTPESDVEMYPTGKETVLVVEDNEAMGRVATKQLEDLGYRVIAANNALEALRALERGEPIDLLFTDVVMPGPLDGIALTHKARDMRPNLKVLLTSGFTQRASDAAGDAALPARLLAKPYRKHHLAKSVRQALDE